MMTKILANFQICISVPLIEKERIRLSFPLEHSFVEKNKNTWKNNLAANFGGSSRKTHTDMLTKKHLFD